MKFELIKNDNANFHHNINYLRKCFDGVPDENIEYEYMVNHLINKRACMYTLIGENVNYTFVGLVNDANEYILIAGRGCGLKIAANEILKAVASQRYKSIRFYAERAGVPRLIGLPLVKDDDMYVYDIEGVYNG